MVGLAVAAISSASTAAALAVDQPATPHAGPAAATAQDPGAEIIGGHEPSQPYPAMASLQLTHPVHGTLDWHTCGAALVSGYWITVNAHCVTDDTGAPWPLDWDWHVRLDTPDRTSGGVVANVTAIIPHWQWAWAALPGRPARDAAMLRLDRYVDRVAFTVPTKPAKVGEQVRLIGWGLTEPSEEGPPPSTLRELDAKRLPSAKCPGITQGEICVSSPNGTDGPCYGDSGSPALHKRDGRWVAAATASGSAGTGMCGTEPTIYTDLTDIRDWMYEVMRTGQSPHPPIDRPTGNLRTASGLNWGNHLLHHKK